MNDLMITMAVPGFKKEEICLFDFTGGYFKQYPEEEIDEMVEDYYQSIDNTNIGVENMRRLYDELTREASKINRSKEWENNCHKYFEYYDSCIEQSLTPYSAEVWAAIGRKLKKKRDFYQKRLREISVFTLILIAIIMVINVCFGGKVPEVYDVVDSSTTKTYITVEYREVFISKSINSYDKRVAVMTVDNAIEYIETYYPETFQYYRREDLYKEIKRVNPCDPLGEFKQGAKIVLPIIIKMDTHSTSNVQPT